MREMQLRVRRARPTGSTFQQEETSLHHFSEGSLGSTPPPILPSAPSGLGGNSCFHRNCSFQRNELKGPWSPELKWQSWGQDPMLGARTVGSGGHTVSVELRIPWPGQLLPSANGHIGRALPVRVSCSLLHGLRHPGSALERPPTLPLKG